MIDPPKATVPDAISKVRAAGVKVSFKYILQISLFIYFLIELSVIYVCVKPDH